MFLYRLTVCAAKWQVEFFKCQPNQVGIIIIIIIIIHHNNYVNILNPIMGRGAFLHAHLGISKAHSNTKLCMYVLCRLVFRRN